MLKTAVLFCYTSRGGYSTLPKQPMTYTFGGYQLDAALPLLLREGKTVAISARALQALVLLVERRHTAVSKRELMEALWPDSFVEEGSLTQLISVLRKALAPGFPERSPIQTIPKLGYRFVDEVQALEPLPQAPVARMDAEAALAEVGQAPVAPLLRMPPAEALPLPAGSPSLPAGLPVATARGRVQPRPQLGWLAAGGLIVLLVAALLGWKWVHRQPAPAQSRAARFAIAVLPFQNGGGSPEGGWVGTAVQELLTTDLRESRELRVLPTEDVQRALQEHGDMAGLEDAATLQQLGADLGCDFALEGRYRLESGRVHLETRLVNVQSGAVEVRDSFTEAESALLPMLAAVSARTVHSLHLPNDGDEGVNALTAGLNRDAYKLYAEGVARDRAYDGKGAVELLQRSIALDPKFPLAHLELSTAWTVRGQEKDAVAEAERALQLADRLPREQQLAIQARVESAKHQFDQAANTYRALASFYPDNQEYGRLLIQSLSSAGKSDAALAETRARLAATGQKPADLRLYSVVADLYSTLGDWPMSLKWAQSGAEESRRRGATILYERLLTTESQATLHLRQYDIAEAQTREALGLSRQFHDVSGELRALNRLGEIATEQKQWDQAEAALQPALQLERVYDQRQREVHTLLALSKLRVRGGDTRAAYRYCQQANELAGALGFVDVVTEAKLQMAVVQAAMGHKAEAANQLAIVNSEAASIHDAYLQQQALAVSATVEAGQDAKERHSPFNAE